MLARISAVRSAPRLIVFSARYKSSDAEGSVAQSKGFKDKEKAHENEYIFRHEIELLKKMKAEIEKKRIELDALEMKQRELEKNQKK